MSIARIVAPLERWAQRVTSNPNLVPQERAFFQKTKGQGLIYLKKEGDSSIYTGYVAVSSILVLTAVTGIVSLATGKGKKPERPVIVH